MQAEIGWGHDGLRTRVAAALRPPSNLTWPAAAVAAGVAVGASVAKGQTKFAILPLCILVAICMAQIPAAGYIAILWSVGTAVDILALPQIGVSSLQFQPAEVLLWVAIGCLVLVPADVRAGLKQMAARGESVTIAVFLGAVAAGVAVGVMNGASVHAAAFQMRYMLFYAAFWPALVALMRGRTLVFKLVGCRSLPGRRPPGRSGARRSVDAPSSGSPRRTSPHRSRRTRPASCASGRRD